MIIEAAPAYCLGYSKQCMEMDKKEVLAEHPCFQVLQEDCFSTLHLFHIHKLLFSHLRHLLLVNILEYVSVTMHICISIHVPVLPRFPFKV